MPSLDIDMFDETPHVGDKVKVMGKIKSINEDSGDVEVSYDDVSIVGDHPKKKKKSNNYNDNFTQTVPADQQMNSQMPPNSQSLDQALAQAFPRTQ